MAITSSQFHLNNVESVQKAHRHYPTNKYRVYNLPFENPIDPGAIHSLVTKGGDLLASPDGWHKVGGAIDVQLYAW